MSKTLCRLCHEVHALSPEYDLCNRADNKHDCPKHCLPKFLSRLSTLEIGGYCGCCGQKWHLDGVDPIILASLKLRNHHDLLMHAVSCSCCSSRLLRPPMASEGLVLTCFKCSVADEKIVGCCAFCGRRLESMTSVCLNCDKYSVVSRLQQRIILGLLSTLSRLSFTKTLAMPVGMDEISPDLDQGTLESLFTDPRGETTIDCTDIATRSGTREEDSVVDVPELSSISSLRELEERNRSLMNLLQQKERESADLHRDLEQKEEECSVFHRDLERKELELASFSDFDQTRFPSPMAVTRLDAETKLAKIEDITRRFQGLLDDLTSRKRDLLSLRDQIMKSELEESVREKLCVICWERPRSVLLLPCKHLCLCSNPACLQVQICPIDRSPIDDKVMGVFVS